MATEFPCGLCGSPIKYSASKCANCGRVVTNADIKARLGTDEYDGNALWGCIGVPLVLVLAGFYMLGSGGQPKETYRLVHAIGNTERVVARGLSRSDCQIRRDQLKATATALGTYNEATGHGSITCLPESIF